MGDPENPDERYDPIEDEWPLSLGSPARWLEEQRQNGQPLTTGGHLKNDLMTDAFDLSVAMA